MDKNADRGAASDTACRRQLPIDGTIRSPDRPTGTDKCQYTGQLHALSRLFDGFYCVHKIQNNISLYDKVTLEEGVFCGPSMVFTNVYNPRSLIERKDEYRDTLVKRGATLGANCTIVCGVTIGEFAFIGAGAVVNKDVKPYALMLGVAAKQAGWMSEYGERVPLPLEGEGEYTCPHTGRIYRLHGDVLEALEK